MNQKLRSQFLNYPENGCPVDICHILAISLFKIDSGTQAANEQ